MGKKNRGNKKNSTLEAGGSDAEVAAVEEPQTEQPVAEQPVTKEEPVVEEAAPKEEAVAEEAAPVPAEAEKKTADTAAKDAPAAADAKEPTSGEPTSSEPAAPAPKKKTGGFFSGLIAKITGGPKEDPAPSKSPEATDKLEESSTDPEEKARKHRWDIIKAAFHEVIESLNKEEAATRSTISAIEYANYKCLKFDIRKLHADCKQWYADREEAREVLCNDEAKETKHFQDEEGNAFATVSKAEKAERASIIAEGKRQKKQDEAAAKKAEEEAAAAKKAEEEAKASAPDAASSEPTAEA